MYFEKDMMELHDYIVNNGDKANCFYILECIEKWFGVERDGDIITIKRLNIRHELAGEHDVKFRKLIRYKFLRQIMYCIKNGISVHN